ncbi:MAG: GreA/GreB family elongation factor [Actinomycetes bacterium]
MPRSKSQVDLPGEHRGRVQLTREGFDRLHERAVDIRERRLPEMRPLLVEAERDERDVAEFERLMAEADAIDALLGQADVIAIDPVSVDGRVELGMRVEVVLGDGTKTWVRPVHPEEAFLDDERVSATSPLAIALMGARAGHTVWVDAPTGAWPCEVLCIDLDGVSTEA